MIKYILILLAFLIPLTLKADNAIQEGRENVKHQPIIVKNPSSNKDSLALTKTVSMPNTAYFLTNTKGSDKNPLVVKTILDKDWTPIFISAASVIVSFISLTISYFSYIHFKDLQTQNNENSNEANRYSRLKAILDLKIYDEEYLYILDKRLTNLSNYQYSNDDNFEKLMSARKDALDRLTRLTNEIQKFYLELRS